VTTLTDPAAATLPDQMVVARDISVRFRTPRGVLRAVSDVNLTLRRGETLGIVGESGSGKSVLCRAVMGLLRDDAGATVSGSVTIDGRDTATLSRSERRHFWGGEIAMVFQDSLSALNPTKTIGRHLTEVLQFHLDLRRQAAVTRALECLAEVGIPDPWARLKQYPHELSGGMRQRVCIALAIACRPKVLIADEPTTALDVTVQRQILDLLERVTAQTGMSTILISHDLTVVTRRSDRLMVMYAGRCVETAPARRLYAHPQHPYSHALLAARPRLDEQPHTRLDTIPGYPPDLTSPVTGCAFAPRCRYATDRCRQQRPPLAAVQPDRTDHLVACFHPMAGTDDHGEVR
jgi:oligopeptide/dipeptide ABC transporter ATP-binding protein